MRVCVHMCMRSYVSECMCATCMCVYVHIYMHMCVHRGMHVCLVQVHIHVCVYASGLLALLTEYMGAEMTCGICFASEGASPSEAERAGAQRALRRGCPDTLPGSGLSFSSRGRGAGWSELPHGAPWRLAVDVALGPGPSQLRQHAWPPGRPSPSPQGTSGCP